MLDVQYCDEDINEDLLKNTNVDDFSNINGLTESDFIFAAKCDGLAA